MKIVKLFLGIIFLFTGTLFLFSQNTCVIRGFVYEKETGEPIIFTNVYLFGTIYGASTDVNGFYNITRIPPGKYTLTVTYLGFDTLKEVITIKPNEIANRKIYLSKTAINLKEINVSAKKEEAKTQVQVSVTKITPREIKQIPTVGGQPDVAQYLQVLPGVIFTGDQGGQLYIRGGSPIQNKVLLDGMVIYNPFHSIGLFSVFDMDIIRNMDVYTGGFGAEYGGRISSIMDITTRDGNKKRISGVVSASPFLSKVLVEGPLKKQKEQGGSSSFIFSAKSSYLEQSSKIFYPYVDTNVSTNGLPFNFTDLYGKVSLNADNGSKINFFGFNFNDNVNYTSISKFHWVSSGAGTNFVLIPGAASVMVKGNIAYSKYKISLAEENDAVKTSEISGYNAGLNFVYFLGKNEINYGIELLGFKTDFNFENSVKRTIQQLDYTTEIAGFFKCKITAVKFLIEPSFRAHYYASLSEFSPEPRLGMKYNLSDKVRLKASGGIYSQNLMSATSNADVVNLFYGFLSGPDNLPDSFNGKLVKSHLQKAYHIIGGMEYSLTKNIDVNIEGYYKKFIQLTNINRNKLYDDNGDNYKKPDYQKKDFVVENGYADGIDWTLKYDTKKIYFWAVYSLSWVRMFDGIAEYYPVFDRRHNINLLGVYKFGDKLDWEFNARWNFGSGFPFTKTQGFYELITLSGGIMSDYTKSNGDLGILYDSINTGRLPCYHRLDITLKKEFMFSETSKLEVDISITNVYNRKNVFYRNRITNKTVYQLPIIPSISLNFIF